MDSRVKKHIALFTILTLLLALVVPFGPPALAAETQTQIYYNGDIQTVDANMTEVEALAVKDGKILATGDLGDVEAAAGADAAKIDLDGNTLLPGFYDAHSHTLMAGESYLTSVQLNSPPTGNIKNMDELVAALSERAAVTEPGAWVIGKNYDDGELAEKRHPTKEDLDKVSTEFPVVITHFSAHNLVANSKALELAGITADTPDPEGGQIGRNADGTPNGQMWELAMGLITSLQPSITHDQKVEALGLVSDIYTKAGFTTMNEGYGFKTFDLYKEAVDKGAIKNRVVYWFGDISEATGAHDALPKTDEFVQYYGEGDLLAAAGVKYLQDGSPQLRTAFLTDPYFTTGDYPEDWVAYPWQSGEELTKKVIDAHQAGINQLYIHGNGDAAIDDVLDAYAEIRRGMATGEYRQVDERDLRHIIIHSQFSREDQLDRMASMTNVLPSFLIMHPYYLGDRHWTVFFGPDRSARMSATQDAVDRNMRFSIHADTPVFPMDGMLMMDTAVNRLSYTGREIFTTTYKEGEKYRSVDQRITPAEALRALTIDAAYENDEQDITGSLETGKRADIIIVNQNPLKVADTTKIKDIKVLQTIVGGKVVYTADGYEQPTDETGYTDISGHWAEQEIMRATTAGYFGGMGNGLFAPDGKMTRAMVVSALHRLADTPTATTAAPFTDVAEGAWYAAPVAWAAENGIVAGMGDDQFAPDQTITREQFSAIMRNYATFSGKTVPPVNLQVLDAYTDKNMISDWALESVAYGVQTKLMVGMTEYALGPVEPVSRAQVATMMNRFVAM